MLAVRRRNLVEGMSLIWLLEIWCGCMCVTVRIHIKRVSWLWFYPKYRKSTIDLEMINTLWDVVTWSSDLTTIQMLFCWTFCHWDGCLLNEYSIKQRKPCLLIQPSPRPPEWQLHDDFKSHEKWARWAGANLVSKQRREMRTIFIRNKDKQQALFSFWHVAAAHLSV